LSLPEEDARGSGDGVSQSKETRNLKRGVEWKDTVGEEGTPGGGTAMADRLEDENTEQKAGEVATWRKGVVCESEDRVDSVTDFCSPHVKPPHPCVRVEPLQKLPLKIAHIICTIEAGHRPQKVVRKKYCDICHWIFRLRLLPSLLILMQIKTLVPEFTRLST
jgi:hypothetical protein